MKISNAFIKTKNNLAQKRYGYFVSYTFLFGIMNLILFMPFAYNGIGFLWNATSADGYTQHWQALRYLGNWGREIITNIFSLGKFEIPMWDFSIGYGSDIVTSMHYYAFGDPLNLLSIIVPSKYSELLYEFLVLLRLYLAGGAFSYLCLKMGKGKTATLAGAVVYTFCGYALFASVRHPFFINPMIYLPLAIWGAEKIMRKENPLLFIFMIFITTFSNFYFLYMTAIAVVMYVLIRYFTSKRERTAKDFIVTMIKYAFSGLLGIGMAAAMFLPVVNVLMSSSRLEETGGALEILHNLTYYNKLIANLFSGDGAPLWTHFGYSAPVFVAIVAMFMNRKKYTDLKIGFCIMFGMTLIPFFGKMMNGFSYVSNRWVYLLAALVAYIVASVWNDILSMSAKKLGVVSVCGIGYFVLLNIFNKKVGESAVASVALIFVTIVLLLLTESHAVKLLTKKSMAVVLVVLMAAGCCLNGYYKYSPNENDYVSEFMSFNRGKLAVEASPDKAAEVATKDDKAFFRHENGKTKDLNATVTVGNFGVQYYWSLENSNIADFLKENGLNSFFAQKYDGLNSRAYLGALGAVKYYVDNSGEDTPYGYEPYKKLELDEKEYKVKINKNPMPLGYTYSSYVDKKDYLEMTVAQRQQAMLQSVVLEGSDATVADDFPKGTPEFTDEDIAYKVKLEKSVVDLGEGNYLVNKKGSKITLKFEGLPQSETYFFAKITDVKSMSKYELYMDDCQEVKSKEDFNELSQREKNQIKQKHIYNVEDEDDTKLDIRVKSKNASSNIYYLTKEQHYSTGQEDFLVNLGYQKNPQNKIEITFPQTGIYSFEEMQVICQPMENYNAQIEALKENVLENISMDTNSVEGTITVDEDKILCFSIPYSTGWSATVDGKETEILKANTMYMAIPLTAGEHSIKLNYSTPLMKTGVCVSMISFGIFIGMLTAYISIAKKRKKQK